MDRFERAGIEQRLQQLRRIPFHRRLLLAKDRRAAILDIDCAQMPPDHGMSAIHRLSPEAWLERYVDYLSLEVGEVQLLEISGRNERTHAFHVLGGQYVARFEIRLGIDVLLEPVLIGVNRIGGGVCGESDVRCTRAYGQDKGQDPEQRNSYVGDRPSPQLMTVYFRDFLLRLRWRPLRASIS